MNDTYFFGKRMTLNQGGRVNFSNGGPGFYNKTCLLYTSPSPRDRQKSRMPSSA